MKEALAIILSSIIVFYMGYYTGKIIQRQDGPKQAVVYIGCGTNITGKLLNSSFTNIDYSVARPEDCAKGDAPFVDIYVGGGKNLRVKD